MLVNTNTMLSYKCPVCGSSEILQMSIFELSQKDISFITCRCKKSGIRIRKKSFSKFEINVPCFACGDSHNYPLLRRSLFANDTRMFVCPKTSTCLCVMGSELYVRKQLNTIESQLDEIIDSLGYEHEFYNARVMLDSLNLIHDIAEKGGLFCECGSRNIELTLHTEKIVLKCSKCRGRYTISAISDDDYQNLTRRKNIILESNENSQIK